MQPDTNICRTDEIKAADPTPVSDELETETQWCAYHGEHPDDGWRLATCEAGAYEDVQDLKHPNGIARRTVTYGPWEIVATNPDPDEDS